MKRIIAALICMGAFNSSEGQELTKKTDHGPYCISAGAAADFAGKGPFVQYERTICKNGKWVLVLPFAGSFDRISTPYTYNGEHLWHTQNVGLVVFSPGIDFYPTGNTGIVRYALGVSVLGAIGTGRNPSYTNDAPVSRAMFGARIKNSLNLQVSPHFRLRMEVGLGPGTDNGANNNTSTAKVVLGQASVSAGYRW